tara:strand:- start:5416 stop:5814 length:399 start_codon:yes stop_codon:yes gene_type:complete
MLKAVKGKKRLALLFAILLTVFSTGIAIADQCLSSSSNQVAMQHHYSDAKSVSSVATKPLHDASTSTGRLINSGCAALFIVVLLLGRKYFDFKASRSRLNSFVTFGRELAAANRPQVFHLALSRPQLGVIRI